MIKRALISVSNKEGIIEFAQELEKLGVEIIATGGTAEGLKKAGIKIKDVSDYTGFPEIMSGRVKTLHPKVHGGILAVRNDKTHMREARENQIEMIDLLAVNFYSFKDDSNKELSSNEVIETIDVGGPAMVRGAAKNFRDILVIVDPKDYHWVIEVLKAKKEIPLEKRKMLAQKVFETTANYDTAIASYLDRTKV